MAAIGRLALTRSLKRFFELTGSFSPSLGEGIVPTVQIANLADTPFSVALPWVGHNMIAAGIGELGWGVILNEGPDNCIVSIDEITVRSATAAVMSFAVQPWLRSILPTLTNSLDRFAICALQEEAVHRPVNDVSIRVGTSTQLATLNAPVYSHESLEAKTVRGSWSIGKLGALVIVQAATNAPMDVSAAGRVHYTTAK